VPAPRALKRRVGCGIVSRERRSTVVLSNALPTSTRLTIGRLRQTEEIVAAVYAQKRTEKAEAAGSLAHTP